MSQHPSVDPKMYIAYAKMGNRYLDAAKILLESQQFNELSELEQLGLGYGPIMFLLGHSTELLLKSLLFAEGVDEEKLKKFKGFSYIEKDGKKIRRAQRSLSRQHNIEFLFRVFLLSRDQDVFWEGLDKHIFGVIHDIKADDLHAKCIEKTYARRYYSNLKNLGSNYDRPFSVRYPKAGSVKISSPTLLVAGADFLWKEVSTKSGDYDTHLSNRASGVPNA